MPTFQIGLGPLPSRNEGATQLQLLEGEGFPGMMRVVRPRPIAAEKSESVRDRQTIHLAGSSFSCVAQGYSPPHLGLCLGELCSTGAHPASLRSGRFDSGSLAEIVVKDMVRVHDWEPAPLDSDPVVWIGA